MILKSRFRKRIYQIDLYMFLSLYQKIFGGIKMKKVITLLLAVAISFGAFAQWSAGFWCIKSWNYYPVS